MSANERVTWETCPSCGRCAAVGWQDRIPVNVDCPSGCQLTGEEFDRRAQIVSGLPLLAARWRKFG